MKLLIDTHLLVWSINEPDRLSADAKALLSAVDNVPFFSVASLWEIAIKSGLGRADFDVDPALLRRGLLDSGWQELTVVAAHAIAVARLPSIHRDPFDRLLIAQAESEGLILLTRDNKLARYKGAVRLV